MHHLLLMRHAKSAWPEDDVPDHERPLAPRGIEAAQKMAAYLAETECDCDLVLCSSATRAVQTLDLVRAALPSDVKVDVSDDLYGADARALLARIREVDAGVGTVLVIGHNPGLHELAVELTGGGDPVAIDRLEDKFPTAAVAVLEIGASSWERLSRGWANLSAMVLPRRLP